VSLIFQEENEFILSTIEITRQTLGQHMNQAQIYGLIGLGVFFLGAAAAKVRYAGHIFYANDLRRFSNYIASIPIGYSMMVFSKTLLGFDSKQRLISTAIMSAAAFLLDGVALMWFPTLYENPPLQKRNPQLATAFSGMGAAWILWDAEVCLSIS
jgi:hypothetical protein